MGVHESLEIHELLTFKSLCFTKAVVMQRLVIDQSLKEIMQQDVTRSANQIEELRSILT